MSNIADKTISEWLEERRASERPPPPAKTSWFWKIIGWSFVANLAIFGGMASVNLLVNGPAIVVMLCLGVAAYLCDPYRRPKPGCERRASQIRPSQSG